MIRRLLPLLLLSLSLHAYDCFQFMAGGEALYWKPCSSDFQYGFRISSPSSKTKGLSVNPEYDWGFRVFVHGTDQCDRHFVTLDWTYFRPTTTNKASGPNSENIDLNFLEVFQLQANEQTQAIRATANERHKYSKVSLRGGLVFHESCCGRIYGYVGGRWVDIHKRMQMQSVGLANNPDVFTKQTAQFNGGGIEVGFGGETTPRRGFGITGRIAVAALIGEEKSTAFAKREPLVIVNQCDPTETICRPAMEMRAGIFAIFGCKCIFIRGEIGYQLDYYFRLLRTRKPQLNAGALFQTNVGYGGPYATIGLIF